MQALRESYRSSSPLTISTALEDEDNVPEIVVFSPIKGSEPRAFSHDHAPRCTPPPPPPPERSSRLAMPSTLVASSIPSRPPPAPPETSVSEGEPSDLDEDGNSVQSADGNAGGAPDGGDERWGALRRREEAVLHRERQLAEIERRRQFAFEKRLKELSKRELRLAAREEALAQKVEELRQAKRSATIPLPSSSLKGAAAAGFTWKDRVSVAAKSVQLAGNSQYN